VHSKFWSEKLKGRDHLKDLCIDGKITIRMDLREAEWKVLDLKHLAHERRQWRILVNTVINHQIS
jgi:hypothetical protein